MKSRSVWLSAIGGVSLVAVVLYLNYHSPQLQVSVKKKGRPTLAAGLNITPSYTGKFCPDRPGSPYPNEGSGNCRGNLSVRINLPTVGPSLVYNSLSNRNVGFGVGWSVSADSVFEVTGSTTGVLYMGDGTPIAFTLSGTSWAANNPLLFRDTLTVTNATTLVLSRVDGTSETYTQTSSVPTRYARTKLSSRQGTLFTISRWNGGQMGSMLDFYNHLVFAGRSLSSGGNMGMILDTAESQYALSFDGNNNLTKITYPSPNNGDSMTMTYLNGTSLLSTVTDPQGRTTTYTYFTSVTPSPLQTITDYQGYQTVYSYTPTSVSMVGFAKTLTETFASSAGGTSITTVEDGANSTASYDSLMRVLKTTDYFGRVNTYTYNGSTPYLQSSTRPEGTVVTYQYDANKYLTNVTETLGKSSVVTAYTRDAYENVTNVSVNNVATKFAYDAQGNVSTVTDPAGKVAFSGAYTGPGLMTSGTTLQGYQTKFVYTNGLMTQVTAPTGEVVARTPSALDQTLGTSSNFGSSSTYTYDVTGRMTSANATLANGANSFTESLGMTYPVATASSSGPSPIYNTTTDSSFYNGQKFDGSTTSVDINGRTASESETTYQ